MASSCPSKQIAVNKMREKFDELARANPRMSKELSDISAKLAEGVKSGGAKKRSSRRKRSANRKRRGGMPPPREEEPNKLLTALAHIIATGTIIGGSGALYCYIVPAIEAYAVSIGWIPKLCSNTSSIQWVVRSIMSSLPTGVESCMAIQARYNLIITQITAAVGVPTTAGFFLKRQAIYGNYISYETVIYNALKYTTDKMRDALSKNAAKPELNEDEIKAIVDEAIEREINLDMTPEQKKHLAELEKKVQRLERGEESEEEQEDFGYALSEAFGGRKRRSRRKHRTVRKHKRKSTRRQRTRKH